MNRLAFLLCFFLWPILSTAGVSIGELNNIVRAPDYLEGWFRQDKYLSDLDVTLSSAGVFNYRRDELIRWETLEPIQNVLLMTPQRIVNTQGGKEITTMDIKSNPAVAILSDIFFSVLTAKWEALETYFSLKATLVNEQWHVVLVPVNTAMTQAIIRITLKGDTLLREVVFYEKNGDRTVIHFENLNQ